MVSDITPQQSNNEPVRASRDVDPHAYLRPEMRVVGEQGKSIGKVEALVHDEATGKVTAITVRHGLFRRQQTSVPIERVKWVNQDSVVIEFSPSRFKKLPRLARS